MDRVGARPAASPLPQITRSQRWLILGACLLVSAANLIRPPLWLLAPSFPAEAFGASWERFWNISAASTVVLMTFILAGGVLGDLYGRRRVLLIGSWAYMGAVVLAALALGPVSFYLFSSLAGVAAALTVPLTVALIRLSFEREELPYAFALFTAGTGIASLGSSALGGPIKALFGWRALFVLPLLLGAVGLYLALRSLPESRARGGYRPIDAVGLAAWSGVILALVFGLIQVRVAGLGGLVGWSALGVAAVGVALLAWWELATPGPVLRNPPFPRAALSIVVLTGMVISFAMLGYSLQLFGFLQTAQGFGPVLGGIALAPLVIGLVAAALPSARLFGRTPAHQLIVGGLGLMLLAMLLTALAVLWLGAGTPYLIFAACLLLFGAGFTLANTAWETLYMGSVPAGLAGLSAAISSAAGQLGGVIAGTALGLVLVSFGRRDFALQLEAAGVPPERVAQATAALDRLLQPEVLADPLVSQEVAARLLEGYRESYAVAFAYSLLVAVAITLACIALIWFGLRPVLLRQLGARRAAAGAAGEGQREG
jgi:MFS transporter, DHA2 family, multidrug resistance protein